MRAMLISLVLFATIVVGSFGANAYRDDHLNDLCALLDTVAQQITADNWSAAQATFATVEERWQQNSPFWHLMADHQTLIDVEANQKRVGAYINAEDFAQGTAELAALASQYQQMRLLEKITLENIL